MLHGSNAHGGYPHGGFDLTYARSVADALTTVLGDSRVERSWLARLLPRDKSTSTEPATLLNVDLSTDGHLSFPDDGDDIQYYEGLLSPYNVTQSVAGLWGMGTVRVGELTISDRNGDYRSLCNEDWQGRQCDIYLGPRGGRQNQFGQVARLVSRHHRFDRHSLNIIVDDYSYLFDSPLQTEVFTGAGGLAGDPELEGVLKPTLLGERLQIEPVIVESSTLTYQVHTGSIDALSNLEQGGNAITFVADVNDITTSTPPANTYITSLKEGYIKLGTEPVGVLTCDVQGHNSSAYGYVSDVAGLLKLLATTHAGMLDPSELDIPAFDAIAASHPWTMGLYASGRASRTNTDEAPPDHGFEFMPNNPPSHRRPGMTIREAANIFLQSAGASAVVQTNKVLTIWRVADPDTLTHDFDIDAQRDDIIGWNSLPLEKVVYCVRVGYKFFSRTLDPGELNITGRVDELYDRGEPYRYVDAQDTAILKQNAQARRITILTALTTEADAQALADEQFALRSVEKRIVTVRSRTGLIKRKLGDVPRLIDSLHPLSPLKMIILKSVNSAGVGGASDTVTWECLSN